MRLHCFLLVILFCSCGGSYVEKKLSGSDSLVIRFNQPGTGTEAKTVSTTESKAIRKLARWLSGGEKKTRDCPVDGGLLFYREGELLLAAVFSMSGDSCRQFFYELDHAHTATRMSPEAADFLKSLAEGRSAY